MYSLLLSTHGARKGLNFSIASETSILELICHIDVKLIIVFHHNDSRDAQVISATQQCVIVWCSQSRIKLLNESDHITDNCSLGSYDRGSVHRFRNEIRRSVGAETFVLSIRCTSIPNVVTKRLGCKCSYMIYSGYLM